MTTYQVKARTSTEQRATLQYITLENVRLGLEFKYSLDDARWYMWLRQPNGTRTAGPIALVAGLNDLFAPYHYLDYVPPGRLYVETFNGADPGLEDLDVSSKIYYETSE